MSAANARRVLILSNRLPVSVTRVGGEIRVAPSAGGLATGLSGVISAAAEPVDRVAWTFRHLTADAERGLARSVPRQRPGGRPHRGRGRPLLRAASATACSGRCFITCIGQLPLEVEGYDLYEPINRRFADAVVAEYRPGDTDLGSRLPADAGAADDPRAAARGAHRLFPPHPVPVLRRVPHAAVPGQILRRAARRRPDRLSHRLVRPQLRLVGARAAGRRDRTSIASVATAGRVRIGVFPMGVDAAAFDACGRDRPSCSPRSTRCGSRPTCACWSAIDRLDYTKGIPRRLLAFERCCATTPSCAGGCG